ncbi:MAG: hypothetical protein QM811_13705 [Pirellulales bacterium]
MLIAVGYGVKTWVIDPAQIPPPGLADGKKLAPPATPDPVENPIDSKSNDDDPNQPADPSGLATTGSGKAVELDTVVRPGWFVIPAARFTRGLNMRVVEKEKLAYTEPVEGRSGYFVEYEFEAPSAGIYYLELQYRNPRSAGMTISLNDRDYDQTMATSSVPTLPENATDGWIRLTQTLPLQAGKNSLKFYSSRRRTYRGQQSFPDLARIALQTTKEVASMELAAANASQPWNDANQLGADPRPFAELRASTSAIGARRLRKARCAVGSNRCPASARNRRAAPKRCFAPSKGPAIESAARSEKRAAALAGRNQQSTSTSSVGRRGGLHDMFARIRSTNMGRLSHDSQ